MSNLIIWPYYILYTLSGRILAVNFILFMSSLPAAFLCHTCSASLTKAAPTHSPTHPRSYFVPNPSFKGKASLMTAKPAAAAPALPPPKSLDVEAINVQVGKDVEAFGTVKAGPVAEGQEAAAAAPLPDVV